MDKSNIVLTRIDNRLVHGQVGVTWVNTIGANVIVVVDEEVTYDKIRQRLMESVARAADVEIRFYGEEEFACKYHEVASNQRLFVVVQTPAVVRKLVDLKVDITSVNVGNMHYERGKVPLSKKAYVSENDIEDFNYLMKQGVELFYQDVPGTIIEKIDILDYQSLKKRR